MSRAREIADLVGGATPDIILKTSDGAILNLQTSDTTVTANSVLGEINFQAPDEASGTDAILVASKIEAVAEGTFSASSNATSLVFTTANSAAAGTASGKMTFTSGGELILKDTDTADGSSPTITLQSGDTDIAADDVLGTINFQAPDEGAGTDAILVAAGIAAISEGDFSSSANATSLIFKTGASEAAAEKMRINSDGNVIVGETSTINGGNLNVATSAADATFSALCRSTTDSHGVNLIFQKSSTNSGNFAATADGENLGKIIFRGVNTSSVSDIGAQISVVQNGTDSGTVPADMVFTTKEAERMRIDKDGNIGIGETTPSTDLVVKQSGSTFTASAQTVALFQRNSATGSGCKVTILSGNNTAADLNFGDAQDEDVGKISYNHSTDSMHFTTNAIERISISSNGTQEHTATSTSAITTGAGMLTLIAATARSSGNGPFIGFRVPNSTGGTTHEDMGALGFLSPDSTDGNRLADFVILTRNTSFNEKFRIAANGQITATDTSISSNSDSRLKKDITDYTYDLDKFKNYGVKKFNWKHPEFHLGKTNQIGFLAQDLQGVDSQWVSEVPLQPKDENGDAHVEAQYLDEDLVSLTSKLGEKDAMYVSIIQQLIAKVETLETKVKTLEDA